MRLNREIKDNPTVTMLYDELEQSKKVIGDMLDQLQGIINEQVRSDQSQDRLDLNYQINLLKQQRRQSIIYEL